MVNDTIPPVGGSTLDCLASADDDLAGRIRADLAKRSSALDLMKGYLDELAGEADNDAMPFRKLRRLFELGATPDAVEGHHYGVAVGLRTGDLHGIAADFGNLLGLVWGRAIGPVAPWVGKSFAPARAPVADTAIPRDAAVFRGINHFRVLPSAPINVAGNALLNFLWHLGTVPDAEKMRFGHDKDGGNFVAHRARSVYAGTPREVFRLNYRYASLDNVPPLTYLVDELVTIGPGLYLGQLLFATEHLLERFDPAAPDASHGYQHFGYFVLFDERWNAEAARLFPHLGVPEAALSAAARAPSADKFTSLTLASPPDGDVDPALLDEVETDLAAAGHVIDLFKGYSDALAADPDTRSPVFAKLHALFNAGVAPVTMDGFYRGAVVTFQSQGLLAACHANTLNLTWRAARFFTPWTGKRFDPIDRARLAELTDGFETMDVPTAFGANTVAFRSPRQKAVAELMKVAGAWVEPATEAERAAFGYDAKTFFFIGKQATSIVPENKGKRVYQFNYRWKGLRTLPPDALCVDEIVQVADGLFLGKLIYATQVMKPWDPTTDPFEYDYRLFGYFLLMDEEWHARRLRIGFDLDDT